MPPEQRSLLGNPESCQDYLHQARNINFYLFSVFLSDVQLIILAFDIMMSRFQDRFFSSCHGMGMPQSYEEFASSRECSFPVVEGDTVHAPKASAGFYSLHTNILTLHLTFLRPLWLETVLFVCCHGGSGLWGGFSRQLLFWSKGG